MLSTGTADQVSGKLMGGDKCHKKTRQKGGFLIEQKTV